MNQMPAFDIHVSVGHVYVGHAYVGRSRAIHFMQDIESHTIIYLRALLATRAVDDPDIATFPVPSGRRLAGG
jgi:hypothetical protein